MQCFCHFLVILALLAVNGTCIAGIYFTSMDAREHSDLVSSLFAFLLSMCELAFFSMLIYYLHSHYRRPQTSLDDEMNHDFISVSVSVSV